MSGNLNGLLLTLKGAHFIPQIKRHNNDILKLLGTRTEYRCLCMRLNDWWWIIGLCHQQLWGHSVQNTASEYQSRAPLAPLVQFARPWTHRAPGLEALAVCRLLSYHWWPSVSIPLHWPCSRWSRHPACLPACGGAFESAVAYTLSMYVLTVHCKVGNGV